MSTSKTRHCNEQKNTRRGASAQKAASSRLRVLKNGPSRKTLHAAGYFYMRGLH